MKTKLHMGMADVVARMALDHLDLRSGLLDADELDIVVADIREAADLLRAHFAEHGELDEWDGVERLIHECVDACDRADAESRRGMMRERRTT